MEPLHLFVSDTPAQASRLPSRRWSAAFPAGRSQNLSALLARSASNEVVWLSSTAPDWKEALSTLVSNQPGRPVVVLSPSPDPTEGLSAISRGARGYTHLHAVPSVLQEVGRVVVRGGLWVGPELVDRVVAATRKLLDPSVQSGAPAGPDPLAVLSAREAEVARAVAAGCSNKEVAEQLGISERTVKAHLGAAFEKLGVRDRLQLVLRVTRGK
ncbi:MAG: response regulator transcription factor [Rhodocyclaceae bacterium]|nr:response regulator transcription factor [Rhodocyclaceae bacterium]